jgi:hypothetical protein
MVFMPFMVDVALTQQVGEEVVDLGSLFCASLCPVPPIGTQCNPTDPDPPGLSVL